MTVEHKFVETILDPSKATFDRSLLASPAAAKPHQCWNSTLVEGLAGACMVLISAEI